MKRTFQGAFAVAALLASSSAWAQNFGEKRQLAISAERLFGITYDSATVRQNNGNDDTSKVTGINLLASPVTVQSYGTVWGGYGSPRIAADYFIIDHLSLGAALGYAHWSFTRPLNANTDQTVSGDTFTFAPRVGYAIAFNDLVGIWPRGGFTYRSFSGDNVGAHDLAFTLEAPFTFNVFPHVVFWGGPTLDIGLSGSSSTHDDATGITTSHDFNATEFGLQTAMLVYFGT